MLPGELWGGSAARSIPPLQWWSSKKNSAHALGEGGLEGMARSACCCFADLQVSMPLLVASSWL